MDVLEPPAGCGRTANGSRVSCASTLQFERLALCFDRVRAHAAAAARDVERGGDGGEDGRGGDDDYDWYVRDRTDAALMRPLVPWVVAPRLASLRVDTVYAPPRYATCSCVLFFGCLFRLSSSQML